MASTTAAWINIGAVTAIGTAAITAADDTLTFAAAHGLVDGDRIAFDNLTGGADGPLVVGAVYYVRNKTDTTLQVSGDRGDALIAFTADGGADAYAAVPAYSAETMRQFASHLLFHGSANRLGAREGVRPGAGDPVSVSATEWTVEVHTGTVEPGYTTTQGPYTYVCLGETGNFDPADASNARLDALDLRIRDTDVDDLGFREADVVYTAGAPSGTPVAPTATAGALRLATVLVPASGGGDPSINSLAPWTVASGGVLPVRDASELPTTGLYVGMVAYNVDTGALVVWDGTEWKSLVDGTEPRGHVLATSTLTSSSHFGSTEVIVTEDAGDTYTLTFPAEANRLYRVDFLLEAADKDDTGTDDDASYGAKGSVKLSIRYAAGTSISTSSSVCGAYTIPVFDNNSDRAVGGVYSGWFTAASTGDYTVGITAHTQTTPSGIRLLRDSGSPMNKIFVTDLGAP